MLYVDLDSFFEIEVASALHKQQLLEAIAAGLEAPNTTFEEEGNVYRIIIRFTDNHVKIWDTIMGAPENKQVPYTTTLEAFSKLLKEYVIRR
ncbi:hypothetical protein E5K00_02395 [Hymenobacter aquaticus]|uniref:Uncharacterized protein n=1 Tax=Hymenobacter aquaticus TaxID=1867101 RepID=A0A4Z0Q3C0_9BACT|nr:hypothetical protein [Hymenobacter aquaticus]TGE24084.1 hypothetical protein E5K00_02395 [Hymenobacter aquaticus]